VFFIFYILYFIFYSLIIENCLPTLIDGPDVPAVLYFGYC